MKAHTRARKTQLMGTMKYAYFVVSSIDDYVSSILLVFDNGTKIDIRMTKNEAETLSRELIRSITHIGQKDT